VASSPRFQAVERAVARRGFQIVLLLRLSPVFPFNLLNYALGLTPVRFGPYLLASWIGMLPGTLLYVYVGAAGRAAGQAAPRTLGEQLLFYGGLAAAVGVTWWITTIARRALAEAIEPAAPQAR
jgi:uncharacterized membrane protein YdjX (TVP38/TMEM64 family)